MCFAFVAAGMELCLSAERLPESVATLEALQDRMAQGDADAEEKQNRLIAQIETDILKGPRQLPADRRILGALAVFLFSGGNPNIVEKRLAASQAASKEMHLIRGALAYVRADRDAALSELSDLDTSRLDSTVGGRVALVRAILLASSDMPKALENLDTARRLMPGTLIEEAALRRCIAFAGSQKDATRFERCGQSYVRRFAASIYWKDFAEGLVTSAVQIGGSLAALQDMIEPLPAERRRMIALEVARAAVLSGVLDLARASAQWAREIALAQSADMDRANLYLAAANIVHDTGGEALNELRDMDESRLSAFDLMLLSNLRKVRTEIEREPDMRVEEALRILPPSERSDQEGIKP